MSTKIYALVDALGNLIGFFLTGGEAHDLIGADHLLPTLEADTLIAGCQWIGRRSRHQSGSKIALLLPLSHGMDALSPQGETVPMADTVSRAVVAPPRVLTDDASDTLRGILLAVLAYMIWTLGDATAKLVLPDVGVAAAMLWRGVFGAITVLAMTMTRGSDGWRRIVPRRWKLVMARSVLAAFVSVTWYYSWLTMSLADTYAVGFTAPLIMTLLAVPMLGERIRWRRALSTLIGFAGVLVMLRPGGDLWTPVTALLLVGTLVMALTRIMTRQLTTTETPECQAFWLLICHTLTGLILLPSLPGSGAEIGYAGWLGLVFLGVSSGLAHCIFARGYGLAPVSALAPYEYSMMPFAIVFGFILFGDVPSWFTLGGAAVVAASGTYNAYRERVRRAEAA